jgi:hypothetical protein
VTTKLYSDEYRGSYNVSFKFADEQITSQSTYWKQ